MNNIEAYIEGKAIDKKGSGFAVVLQSSTDKWARSFAYGNYKTNVAELLAAKFALLSITEQYQKLPMKLHIKNKYVRDMLERDKDGFWVKVPKANKELIENIRDLLKDRDVEILKSKGNVAKVCSQMVVKAIQEGKTIDSRK